MNLKKLTFVCSVALATFLVPAVSAQSRGGRTQMAASSAPRISAPVPYRSGSQFGGRGSNWTGNRSGNRWSNNDGRNRWGNNDRRGWYHNRCFYPGYSYYGGFGYPFGFGYGYPFGYGYGYPYYGASAALYYAGYNGFGNGGYGYGNGYGYRSGYSDYNGGGSVVVRLQQRLAREGYYRGSIDGVIGGRTRSAIRAWERAHGLRVDGRIDDRLLSSLGIA